MKLLVDDAHIELIKEMYEYYPVSGVTTNPSILSKVNNGKNPYEILTEIREFIGDDELHVQVVSKKAEDMVEEAKEIIKRLGKETFIKVPSITEGFKAIKLLKKEGIKTTATAIYTPMQAYLAATAGASYVAPYVNRIDNMGYDGVATTKKIQNIFDTNGLETEIIGASFKNSNQVLELCEYGVGSCTCAPDIIKNFVNNVAINAAVDAFVKDFEKMNGEGKTMKNI